MILERWFHLQAAGTTVRREVTAGLVTFVTISYILFVQPAMLAKAGMDSEGVLFATCVASAIACFAMAFLALAGFGVRERVMNAVPDTLKFAIAAGIGLLIAMVGLQWAGVVVDDPGFLVGVLMMGAVRKIDWDDLPGAIPAFLAIIAMPLSGSPTEGIAWGFIAWSVLSLLPGQGNRSTPLVHAIALVFVAYYLVPGLLGSD